MKLTSFIGLAWLLILTSCSSELTTEEYLLRGSSYIDKKEWKSAVIEFKNGVKQSPENANARVLLGKAYLRTFSSDAAIKELTKAIELGAEKKQIIVSLGEAYAQRNKNDEIIASVKLIDGLSKNNQLAVLALRAGAYLRKNEPKNALRALEKAKKLDSSNSAVRLMWARYEAQAGSIEKQIKWLAPLLQLNVADAWSQMGDVERIKQNLEKSEIAYTKAIDERKLIHNDYLSRALIRISLKKYDEATTDLKLLKAAGLSTPVIAHSEGVIAFYQNDLDLAQSKLDQVLGKYKQYPPSLFVMGLVHFQKGNFQSAVNSLTQYLKINTKDTQARLVLATSLLRLNKHTEAIVELEQLYKANPNNIKVSSLLGGAYVRNGQMSEGVSLFKKSAQQNPKQASAQFQLGTVLIRDKLTVKKGQQALIKALDLDPSLFQANLALYLSYMQSKSYPDAEKIAIKMIEVKPDESLAYNLLALAFLEKGNKPKAIELFVSTLAKFPSDPITSRNLARIKLQENQVEEAKSIYIDVLDKHPNELKTLISLAVIESKLGNDDAKINYLKKAVQSNNDALSPKLILASEYFKENKFKDVLDLLRDVSDNDKKRLEVQLFNSKAKMGLNEYDYALVLLKKTIARNPASSSAHFLMGQNYGHLKQKENMRASFEQVLKIKPDHLAASLILTRLSLFEGDKDEFEFKIKQLIKAYPENPDVKFLYAKLESNDKNFKSAILTLEGLLKKTPHPEIIIDLARNKWVSGDKDGAIFGVELWLESNPEDKKALMLLAQFYINENRVEDASDTYAKVDKLLPNNAVVLNNMAWLYRKSNVKQGIKLAKRALSLEPKSPFIKDTLAMLLLGDNNASEALIYSKQAADAQPNFIEIQLNYAKVLVATGNKTMAKKTLNSIYSKTKSFDQRQEIRAMLNSL